VGCLDWAGQWEQALAATTEAVESYRRLGETNPDVFEPNLATALTNLGNQLSGLGRPEQALTAASQLTADWRRPTRPRSTLTLPRR
jgi:tetratricopeptide (TPR) repeat protein